MTYQELKASKGSSIKLEKNTMFYLEMFPKSGDLHGARVVLKAGTSVKVTRVSKPAALLQYVDIAGRVWRSWTHGTH